MKKTVVIGGGAAGMMAAIRGAEEGCRVTLLEKNEKLGKKLFITGKGRCNITNDCDIADFFPQVVSNPKFLYSAFYGFSNTDTEAFFHGLGLKTKVERGGRVFPYSDRSSDVIAALKKACEKSGVDVRLNTPVRQIDVNDGCVTGVSLRGGGAIEADAVILATGGVSYPGTGSTGDGYRMAEETGHTVIPARPGLTGLTVREKAPAKLQGLTLRNISLRVTAPGSKKVLFEAFGELLFTHYGVSGPLILTASSRVGDVLKEKNLSLHIDLKPALTDEQLDKRILRDFDTRKNADIKNAMTQLLPGSMIPVLLKYCEISPEKKVNALSREERASLVSGMKDFTVTLTGLRGMEEAVITRGGIRVSEVDPSTMQSKIVSGLYFAGEILDVDALTGGFNLQIAWSTGWLAGSSAACDA